MLWSDDPPCRANGLPAVRRRRLSDKDRRLVAVLQLLDSGLSPAVDQLIAGELTWADRRNWADMFDRAANMMRGRVIDAGRDAGGER